ncbi:MAG: serine protease [Acholeplasmataceae bacterium]|nr:serine protease [Acholeplasmataceae bacterium]
MKRKLWILTILIAISIGLSSCIRQVTYDDLLLEYQSDIEARQDIYDMYVDIYDHLSTTTIQSIVRVTKKVSLSSVTSVGSGFIFYEDDRSYYVLTNHHVVYNDTSQYASITVMDYLGNDHTATLLALDNQYDLAVLSFTKSGFNVDPIPFSQTSLYFKDIAIAMGYPNGQINSMTIGELIDFDMINISNDDETGVTFDVLIMDIPVETGSSGSVVINEDYEVVGIIYAGNFINNQETSEFSFAIPTAKIFEFFELYDIPYQEEVTS